ncbi:MAG: FAD/NAD(P)-binding protein [Bacteroidota bacterium]
MTKMNITIIGSGAASTLTLIEILQKLELQNDKNKKISIAVIEKTGEYLKGIPYGKRSSVNALIITSVHDFIFEPEKPLFYKWLTETVHEWTEFYRNEGGEIAERWLENNLPLIMAHDWEKVYIPRFLFGDYLTYKCNAILERVSSENLVDFHMIQAEVIDIVPFENNSYQIIMENPDGSSNSIVSQKTVIATGSAPVKEIFHTNSEQLCYINDIYEPSVKENFQKLEKHLSKKSDSQILLVGSNASSIELLYLIGGTASLRNKIKQIHILSISGALPVATSTIKLNEYPTPNLNKVESLGTFSILELVDASAADIRIAVQEEANMDHVATIIGKTLNLMQDMSQEDHQMFYAVHAIKLRNMFRRTGPEYYGASKKWLAENAFEIIKGKFIAAENASEVFSLQYSKTGSNTSVIHSTKFDALINCTGSDDLIQSSSKLLYNLVNKNICQMNLSGKGFVVNEQFEAAPNLYVIGPLLGGNKNKLIHFWQLENVARLSYLAPYLVKELL